MATIEVGGFAIHKTRVNPPLYFEIFDVLSLNNHSFGNFIHRIYPKELEIKDTTDTVKSASHL